jgi:hypothetical protein
MELKLGSQKAKRSFNLLPGGGEMGNLIKNFDWASTSLGPIESWPRSLVNTLNLMLHSAFPMLLFWGKEFTCFYNDAYRPSLGHDGKHPSIGRKGSEAWSDIWDFLSPLFDKVMTTGEPVWYEDQLVPIDRNGRNEDVYWTLSYSPAFGDNGEIEGIFVTAIETTLKVKALKNAEASNQRFQDFVGQATVGIIVLVGDDMRVEVVNDAYGRLIGRTSKELRGKRLFEVIPETEQYFRPIINNVKTTGDPLYLFEHPYFVYADGAKIEGFLDLVYKLLKMISGRLWE